MTQLAEIVVAMPLAPSSNAKGTRLVAIDAARACHVLLCRNGDQGTVEVSFTAEEAVRIAHQVLAGDARVCTASASLRILAAALLVCTLKNEAPVGEVTLS